MDNKILFLYTSEKNNKLRTDIIPRYFKNDFLSSPEDIFFIAFRERGRERQRERERKKERNISMRETLTVP